MSDSWQGASVPFQLILIQNQLVPSAGPWCRALLEHQLEDLADVLVRPKDVGFDLDLSCFVCVAWRLIPQDRDAIKLPTASRVQVSHRALVVVVALRGAGERIPGSGQEVR